MFYIINNFIKFSPRFYIHLRVFLLLIALKLIEEMRMIFETRKQDIIPT